MACGSTMNMRYLVLLSMIKFLTKKGKKPKEIHERMNYVYGDVSPSYYQVKFYSNKFMWGRESMKTTHAQVGQWKNLQRKCAKKWRT